MRFGITTYFSTLYYLQTKQKLSHWLESDMKCNDTISIEWLPLSLFDAHSQFVLLFRNVFLDVGICGDTLRVTQTNMDGLRSSVEFGSEIELEIFLKMTIRREL